MELVRGNFSKLSYSFREFFRKGSQTSRIVGICGGRSILPFLDSLLEEKNALEGSHFFLTDERLVSFDHLDSNYRFLKKNFFDKIYHSSIYPFYYNPSQSDSMLEEYQRSFEEEGGQFDLLILGVGEDGHIASLFPNGSVNVEEEGFFYVKDSPKPPSQRITISSSMVQKSRQVVLLFIGESKREALSQFLDTSQTKDINTCPARVALQVKDLLVLTDIES